MKSYENAIEVSGLTKKYDGFTLSDLSFVLPKGSIMGFIGQNGAGKTTTIHAMLNIVHKNSGSIQMLGMDSVADELAIKQRIAVVFDELPFHDQLSARQLDRILKSVFPTWSTQQFKKYLEFFQLPEKKQIGKLSKGMKMKLQIAAALSHGAELLIMDEATTGLDPVVRNEILDIFLDFLQDENHSIFLSSHITSDLDKIADSVTLIDKGKLLVSGYKDEILERHAILKCTKADYAALDPADIVSARLSDFGAEVMISDKPACTRKYAGLLMDPATLESLMLFYVNQGKREWR